MHRSDWEIKWKVSLYFLEALEGKKMDVLRKNNKVTFEMDCDYSFIFYDDTMSCTMGWGSIIGNGIMEFVKKEQKFNATISWWRWL